jgi:hypothetical protein
MAEPAIMRHAWRVLWLALSLTAPPAMARDLQIAPKEPPAVTRSITCERDAQSQWPHTAAERRCLTQLTGIAERTGNSLTLQLENGKTKSFRDMRSGCNPPTVDRAKCLLYRVVAYHPLEHIVIIEVSFYQCGYVLVLDRRTGRQFKHPAIPKRSPNGQRFVAVDDTRTCPHYIDISIFSTADLAKLEWKYMRPPNNRERWEFVRWDDDNRIALRVETQHPKAGPTIADAEVILTNKGWQLYRDDKKR